MEQHKKDKRHFLYFIFQSDRKECIMVKEKANSLRQYLLRLFGKGE